MKNKLYVAVAATVAAGATTLTFAASADASTRGTTVKAADTTVGIDREVTFTVGCSAKTTCRGTLRLQKHGTTSSGRSYAVKAGRTKSVTVKLNAASYRRLVASTQRAAQVVVAQRKPSARTLHKDVTLRPATARLFVDASTALTVGSDNNLAFRVTCGAATPCAGTVTPVIGGVSAAAVSYRIAAQQTMTLGSVLTAAQRTALTAKASAQQLVVAETAPEKVSKAHPVLIRAGSEPTPAPEPEYSQAYLTRNWTPTEYDTCPAALHASYNVTGPDGKIYPTWHPAEVIDPATGKLCTFGHEHGADPKTSDIYDWVADYFDNGQNAANKGIPFGYVSEELENYGHDHSGMTMRHEDNGGHKIQVANDVALLDSNRNWVLDGNGDPVVCDYLMKQHQGSHSADATANNAHELIYAARCTDGTEIIASTLSLFGNANEFNRSCAPTEAVATVGSTLPDGRGGERIIPDATCAATYASGSASSLWGVYELWKGDNQLTTSDGSVLASYDPWFGVRNPSRYYDPSASTATTNGIARLVDRAWASDKPATGFPWSTVAGQEPFDYRDPRSPFDGAQRDFYLSQTDVAASAPDIVYTDPYGGSATSMPFNGSIAQHLKAGTTTPGLQLATQKFDTSADYGKNNGVHAPN